MATKRLRPNLDREKHAARWITKDICAAAERRGIPAFEIACRIAERTIQCNASIGKKVLITLMAELSAELKAKGATDVAAVPTTGREIIERQMAAGREIMEHRRDALAELPDGPPDPIQS